MAEVGATKGALYFHFASKEALAQAVIAEMVQRWDDARRRLRKRGLDPLSVLVALINGVIDCLLDNPIARGGTRLLGELPARGQDRHGYFDFGEQDIAELLTEAARSGLLRDGIEPTVVSRQIAALIAGHRQVCNVLDDRQDLRRRIDEAWALLLPAIATDTWLASWRTSIAPHPPTHGGTSGPTDLAEW
jgi:AcrR family transcriptional regulator